MLIDLPHDARVERVAATKTALESGAPAVFEATFIAADTYVPIDVLEKQGDGYRRRSTAFSPGEPSEGVSDDVAGPGVSVLRTALSAPGSARLVT